MQSRIPTVVSSRHNVNAEIRSREVQNALTIPKEVVRRTGTDSGVFKLVDDKVVWQKVKLGVASVTRIQVLDGLSESDRVALPSRNSTEIRRQGKADYDNLKILPEYQRTFNNLDHGY